VTQMQSTIQPVRRAVTVERPLEDAFRVFTEGLATWWPVATHSIAKDAVETVVMEGRSGGRLYERTTGGAESDWGRMLVWEPPRRVAFEWHITGTPTEVEVRFTPEGDRTRVELEHRGFERLEDGAERRESYSSGWVTVLGRYTEAVSLP
jgi:Activator of Hsp90 ATPase homolog 1-like protein